MTRELRSIRERLSAALGSAIVEVRLLDGGSCSNPASVELDDGRRYVVKKLSMSSERHNEYVQIMGQHLAELQYVDAIVPVGGDDYLVASRWVDGFTLGVREVLAHPRAYLQDIESSACALRRVHEQTKADKWVRCTEDDVVSILNEPFIDDKTRRLLQDYLTDALEVLNGRSCTVVHGDVHLGNIVRSSAGTVFIDCDDVRYADPWFDLAYAANIHRDNSEDEAYYYFLKSYFPEGFPEDFWRIVNSYSLVKFIHIIRFEMAHTAEHKRPSSLGWLIESHENMASDKPRWFKHLESAEAFGCLGEEP